MGPEPDAQFSFSGWTVLEIGSTRRVDRLPFCVWW